jgi:hypothetical protein
MANVPVSRIAQWNKDRQKQRDEEKRDASKPEHDTEPEKGPRY